jgi:hypothetical protein
MELRKEEKKGRFQIERLERRIAPCSAACLPGSLSADAHVQAGPNGVAANLHAGPVSAAANLNACPTGVAANLGAGPISAAANLNAGTAGATLAGSVNVGGACH